MAIALALDNVDAGLGTTLAEVIAAPPAGQEKRVSFTLCNVTVGAVDATVDVTRYDGTTDRYIAKTLIVQAGKPQVFELLLKPGRSLRARASAASAIDFTADVVVQTVS